MNKKNIAILFSVLLLALLAVYRDVEHKQKEGSVPAQAAAAKVPYEALGFTLKDLNGKEYTVGGKRDKPLLLNFWASWCGPCEEEAPDLSQLYDKYKDKIDIYAVNVTGNDDEQAARSFASRFRYHFQVLLDKELVASDLYRVQVIPTSFLIDRNGMVTEVIHLLSAPDLEKKLKKLIDS